MAIIGKNINRKEQFKREQMINERYPVVEQCKEGKGCERIEYPPNSAPKCLSYINPESKWRLGNCLLASHLTVLETGPEKYKPKKYGRKRRGR
jgi:hypothetical protein